MKTINKIINKAAKLADANSLSQELGGKSGMADEVSEEIIEACRTSAAEGAVLLKNDGVLPMKKKDRVAVFGRCSINYFCVGYGSGGDVVYPYKINLIDGLKNAGVNIDEKLFDTYQKWIASGNEPDDGFWGHWPLSYDEMPITDEIIYPASLNNDVAVVVIGRAAGEDRENKLKKGSYYLTDEEENMLAKVTEHFARVAVVLDIGNIMDFSWVQKYNIGAVLIPWQGGMESGNAVADVLTGKVNPCGRLSDTIAKEYQYYPSAKDFGNREYNNYSEDIFVGYRYFETFEPRNVLFPFGFGLSYTKFKNICTKAECKNKKIILEIETENIGKMSGKNVVEVYMEAPQGKLGKPSKVLTAFAKTEMLEKGEKEKLFFEFSLNDFASYDDSGITGHKNSWVLEGGYYRIFVGDSVRECEKVFEIGVDFTVVSQATEVMAVKEENRFDRLENRGGKAYFPVPVSTVNLKNTIKNNLPKAVPMTGDLGYKFNDVVCGKVSLDEFVAQLDRNELEAISRGEGIMHSSFGPELNAGMFGGTTDSLRQKGIPTVITTDGPAGIRLAKTCSLLPCGTLLACTWDVKTIEKLYSLVGDEMLKYGTDVLLAPGMNIHRNPLCGRNFEYFSEDPLITGKLAASVVKGVQHDGLSACPKHFSCNNQEKNRNRNDSRVSQRALREIYFKGFETCVKEAKPLNIMTSYNKINGVWSHYNYELVQIVLRGEWGYDGNVLTDWWMRYSASPEFPKIKGNAYRVRAGVDVLMPGGKNFSDKGKKSDGTLLATYGEADGITLGEMQRTAKNVIKMAMKSAAAKR